MTTIESLKLGNHTYENVQVQLLRYVDGSLAVRLFVYDEEAQDVAPLTTASVNLASYGYTIDQPTEFYLKSYGENEGLAEALVAAGVVKRVLDKPAQLPHGTEVHRYELAGSLLEAFKQANV